jgi:hypothetical protein
LYYKFAWCNFPHQASQNSSLSLCNGAKPPTSSMEWREASLEWREASYFISHLSFALSLKKANNSPQSWSGRSVSGANETIRAFLFDSCGAAAWPEADDDADLWLEAAYRWKLVLLTLLCPALMERCISKKRLSSPSIKSTPD